MSACRSTTLCPVAANHDESTTGSDELFADSVQMLSPLRCQYASTIVDPWDVMSTFNRNVPFPSSAMVRHLPQHCMSASPHDGILLAEYSPEWPRQFAVERTRLLAALGDLRSEVEHIGSTAVPGLIAKPVIDIMIGRPAEREVTPYIDALRRAGYEYRGESGIAGRHYFRRGRPRTHHLHLVEHGGALWRDHLRFRDRLRADPALATEYAALKRRLAAELAEDRAAYTEAKGPFITRVLRASAGDDPGEPRV